MHNPAHAGMLIREWLKALQENDTPVSITQLAERIQITRAILSRIIHGKATLTADVTLSLEVALGISADLLLRVQVKHELWVLSQQPRKVVLPLTQNA